MAAKQGLSAQISQASEDAKRLVLTKAALANNLWFSNLNTTCTIKSAPPRTPDVLKLLSLKSGWLFKRNEQHVWQTRYCCVVPHTFLYYFDANPSDPGQKPTISKKQQEALNKAVKHGYGKRGASKQQQPRSSLHQLLGTANPHGQPPDENTDTSAQGSSLQPAGIIDLECYTTIHRNSKNQLLLELAGDDSVNPDLRSFYFCANSEDEGEEWTQAFLGQRHSSLIDEKEAYRQVCDGFAQQLQGLHTDLENAQHQAEAQQEEVYRVRSQMEDSRRNCLRLVRDTLERNEGTVPAKRAYRADLETIQAQDLGAMAAVQLLCDYTRVLEESCSDEREKNETMEKHFEQKQEGDSSKVTQLQEELEKLKLEMSQQQMHWQTQVETLQQKYIQSQKECQDVQKNLASQRMEMTMYQSATRTKIGELQTHKKILKKEVIELRKRLEDANSHVDLFKHKESSVKLECEQERQKTKLLERYVEKMETQVKVQQNMMEMMSASGSQYGSQYGGGGSHFGDADFQLKSSPTRTVPKPYGPSGQRNYDNILVNTPSQVQIDDDDDNDANDAIPSSSKRNVRGTIDDDAKSHVSELTEDRTQKQFIDAAYLIQQSKMRTMAASPRGLQPQPYGPPAVIGVEEEGGASNPRLDTIMSVQSTSKNSRPRNEIPRYDFKPYSSRTAGDSGSARLEADRSSTPVRMRAASNTTPLRGSREARKEIINPAPKEIISPPPKEIIKPASTAPTPQSSSNSEKNNGFFSNFARSVERAIDDSFLGVGLDDSSYEATDVTSSTVDGKDRSHKDEKKSTDTVSDGSTVSL